MPIRWRLTLWFSFTLCVILILSAAVIHTLLQRYLSDDIDNNLRVNAAKVHGTLNPEQIPHPLDYNVIHSNLPPVNEFASPGIYIQLIDRNGNVVVKSDNLGEQELPVAPSLIDRGFHGNAVIETVPAGDGARVRILVSPLLLRDQTLLLDVAQSLKPVDTVMSQVTWALLAGILAALALVGISGGILVRRALAPVERITRTAQSIEASSDLSRRVGYKGPMDEIGQLATTFDHMIEQLDKVFASQQHFVADASHDLRGPLTVLRGNLDLLKRNLSEEDRRESLRAMGAEIERMSKIVNDLLLLAEVEASPASGRERVSLKEVFQEGYRRAQQLAGNRKVVLGRQEDLAVRGDRHRLNLLLGNLIDNAIIYTPDGGTIALSLFKDGPWARLEVADTGIGIAPEHLPHIFDRFYRVDKARSRAGGGSGLGLAIVKGIAEQHGGKVTVTSELGKGSIFTVWLKL